MAEFVPVTYGKFLKLEDGLGYMGLTEISRHEVGVIMKAYGLRPPRTPRRGEIGFKYSVHGYTVKVWTSCLRDAVERCRRAGSFDVDDIIVSRPVNEDSGWVLITDPLGQAQYFARPIFRTKNFVKTFLQRTWITWKRIKKRPLCPECGKFMEICTNRRNGGNFWGCYRTLLHPDGKRRDKNWDFALLPKELAIAKAWRREFERSVRAAKKKGKKPRRASEVRNSWKATKIPF